MKRLTAALLVATAVATTTAASAHAQQATTDWTRPGDVVTTGDGHYFYAAGSALLAYDNVTGGNPKKIGETPLDGDQLALSPDGRFAYLGGNGVIHVLARDAGTGTLLHVESITGGPQYGIQLGEVRDLAVAPDGATLYVAQRRENAFVALERNPATGALSRGRAFFADTDALPYNPHIAVSPDSRDVYLAGQMLTHFHADASGQLTRGFTTLEPIDGVIVSRNGTRVYAASGDSDRIVYARDADSGALTQVVGGYTSPTRGCSGCWPTAPLALGANDRLFAARGEAGELQSFGIDGDAFTLAQTLSFQRLPHIASIAAADDGSVVYATGGAGTPGEPRTNVQKPGAIQVLRSTGGTLGEAGQAILPTVAGWVPARTPGVSIADGELFVNSRDVTVTVKTPAWRPAAFEISNDGGFANATRMAVDPSGEYSWRLPAGTTPAREVKHVYVRFVPNGLPDVEFPATSVVRDDVILDTRAPQLVSAKRSGKRIALKARDNRSGVKQLYVTTDKKRPGPARKFRSKVAAPKGKKAAYVRVVDGAGNRSGWKRVR